MIHTVKFRMVGVVDLMMHNGRLADPMDEFSIKIAEVTGKRKKTVADRQEVQRLEFLGGLYTDAEERVCLPSANIEGMLADSARKIRMGQEFLAGVTAAATSFRLVYEGPQNLKQLEKATALRDVRGVKMPRGGSVQRCRPRFPVPWSAEVAVIVDDRLVDPALVLDRATYAGIYIGICDYTPKFGRFEVEAIS